MNIMGNYTNYEWFLKEDFSRYAGDWIAIIDKQVVANGKDAEKVISCTKKEYPNKRPLITKIKDKLSIL